MWVTKMLHGNLKVVFVVEYFFRKSFGLRPLYLQLTELVLQTRLYVLGMSSELDYEEKY